MDSETRPKPNDYGPVERGGRFELTSNPPDPEEYGFADDNARSSRMAEASEGIARSVRSIKRLIAAGLYGAILVGYM